VRKKQIQQVYLAAVVNTCMMNMQITVVIVIIIIYLTFVFSLLILTGNNNLGLMPIIKIMFFDLSSAIVCYFTALKKNKIEWHYTT